MAQTRFDPGGSEDIAQTRFDCPRKTYISRPKIIFLQTGHSRVKIQYRPEASRIDAKAASTSSMHQELLATEACQQS